MQPKALTDFTASSSLKKEVPVRKGSLPKLPASAYKKEMTQAPTKIKIMRKDSVSKAKPSTPSIAVGEKPRNLKVVTLASNQSAAKIPIRAIHRVPSKLIEKVESPEK